MWKTDKGPFEEAIGATIKAITTGVLTSRSGVVLQQGKAISEVTSQEWRSQMDQVVTVLQRIRERARTGATDAATAEAIDEDRDAVISAMNVVWSRLAIPQMSLPSKGPDLTDRQE
jgi:hypothetical protein